MKKRVQDLKVERESIKKTQTEGNLKIEKLGPFTGTSEASLPQNNTRNGRQNLRH